MIIKQAFSSFCRYNLYKSPLHKNYSLIASVLNSDLGETAEVKGWVKNLRVQKEHIFADVYDGSSAEKLQVIIPKKFKTGALTYGSSVHITGTISKSPKGQRELIAQDVKVIGKCVVIDGYPFNPRTAHPPEYVRQYLHLRSRTNYMSAILRVRHSITKHIHDYFNSKNYTQINTPVLTSNDCEGAGELFKVQPESDVTVKTMMQKGQNRDTAYFGRKSYLTVSGQLHLEAICRGMGNVYTLGPTFRAENSRSRLHLSEFYMLEAEIAFCDTLEQLKSVIEDLLKYVFIQTRNTNEADLFLIDKKNTAPGWLKKDFITVTYEEAKNLLQKKSLSVSVDGLNKEEELALVDMCQGVPVFVVEWPKHLKSFYMKESPANINKVNALDLLTPITGEIVGGSLREDDYVKLKQKLPSEALNWYLELRKFGNIPTGGFGLGLERLMQVVCSISNIKDTLPFPRWPHNCDM